VARFNIANALGAILAATAIGVPRTAIAAGLRAFRGTPEENPGRSHLFDFGATVLVDFAHNPHGQRALIEAAKAMPAKRKAIIIGRRRGRSSRALKRSLGLGRALKGARRVVHASACAQWLSESFRTRLAEPGY